MRLVAMAATLTLLAAACGTEVSDAGASESTTTTIADPSSTTTTTEPEPIDTIPATDTTIAGEAELRSYSSLRSLPEFATPSGTYSIVSTVIQDVGEPPVVCSGPILASLPPQCSGIELRGFAWEGLGSDDAHPDVRWGSSIYLEGVFDRSVFVVSLVRPATDADRRQRQPSDYSSPCTPPAGGWAIVDDSVATDADFNIAAAYAQSLPDMSAVWVTQPPIEVPDPVDMILNVAVVDNLEEHTAELRARWGGPLCVFERPGLASELRAIQQEIVEVAGDIGTTTIGTDELNRVVNVSVIVADPGTVAYFAERWGTGVVQVSGAFQPVEG